MSLTFGGKCVPWARLPPGINSWSCNCTVTHTVVSHDDPMLLGPSPSSRLKNLKWPHIQFLSVLMLFWAKLEKRMAVIFWTVSTGQQRDDWNDRSKSKIKYSESVANFRWLLNKYGRLTRPEASWFFLESILSQTGVGLRLKVWDSPDANLVFRTTRVVKDRRICSKFDNAVPKKPDAPKTKNLQKISYWIQPY